MNFIRTSRHKIPFHSVCICKTVSTDAYKLAYKSFGSPCPWPRKLSDNDTTEYKWSTHGYKNGIVFVFREQKHALLLAMGFSEYTKPNNEFY